MGLGAAWSAAAAGSAPRANLSRQRKPATPRFELGLASRTFRAFGLDDALAMTRKLGLKRISLSPAHLPMDAGPEELRAAAAKVKAAGLELYAAGVVRMKAGAEVRRAFEYAKTAGLGMIIASPGHDLLPLVHQLAGEYDIGVAIHNDGPGDKLYPAAADAYERILGLDRRIGLCLDVGQTRRLGIDPALDAVRFIGRLFDVYLSDVTEDTENGEPCELGTGAVDLPFFLRSLVRMNYSGSVTLDYGKDEEDPVPGVTASLAYLRKLLGGQSPVSPWDTGNCPPLIRLGPRLAASRASTSAGAG